MTEVANRDEVINATLRMLQRLFGQGYKVSIVVEDRKQATKIEEAARKLVEKIDQVHENPEFQGVWSFLSVHGQEYRGPGYREELQQLREVLKRISD